MAENSVESVDEHCGNVRIPTEINPEPFKPKYSTIRDHPNYRFKTGEKLVIAAGLLGVCAIVAYATDTSPQDICNWISTNANNLYSSVIDALQNNPQNQ